MSEVLDVLGPRLQHLTKLSDDQDYCLMKGEVGPGVFVPLHSHGDRETFFILSGELKFGQTVNGNFPARRGLGYPTRPEARFEKHLKQTSVFAVYIHSEDGRIL